MYFLLTLLIIIFVIIAVLWIIYKKFFLIIFCIFILALILFTLYFFRDPVRIMPDEENIIIAPADGKIIDVQHNQDLLSYDKKFIELSIYLSLWDVHINRIPVSGTVFYMKYQKGRFHPAFTKEASLKNESNLIGIKTKFGDVFVKQIAGKIVRRIVCNISRGDTVVIGQKFGMIKFGSRVELFLPQNVDLLIKEGSLVKGSESIIGTFNEK